MFHKYQLEMHNEENETPDVWNMFEIIPGKIINEYAEGG